MHVVHDQLLFPAPSEAHVVLIWGRTWRHGAYSRLTTHTYFGDRSLVFGRVIANVMQLMKQRIWNMSWRIDGNSSCPKKADPCPAWTILHDNSVVVSSQYIQLFSCRQGHGRHPEIFQAGAQFPTRKFFLFLRAKIKKRQFLQVFGF